VDLRLTEEQRLLSEAVAELIGRAEPDGAWTALVEFGALEPELGVFERALVAREVGFGLAAVPYVESAAVRITDVDLPPTASTAACLGEPGATFSPTEPQTALEGGLLTGEKTGVAFAESVDFLALTAGSPEGLVIALVPPTAATIEPETALDPALELATVRVENVAPVAVAAADLGLLAAAGAVLAAAEAVGAAGRVLELACEYAAQRRQFGRTIGSFQAIRHLLADMYVKVESSWSSVLYAAASLDEAHADALRTASIAKAYSARSTQEVAHGALQVFGGIAFTDEHPAHRYLRRVVTRGGQFGTAREHERALGWALARPSEVVV
jgi:alkylation response protein AidB-like acyl-CoA dehydrogenase